MTRKLFLLTLLASHSLSWAEAQMYLGYNTSNYAGINSISINPANVVDSRYLVDINLAGFDFNLSNNYLGLSTKLFRLNNSPFADTTYNNNFQAFRRDFFQEDGNISQARIFQSLQVQTPSIAFNIGKNSFAITTAAREYFYVDNLEPKTAAFILSELNNQNTWNIDLNNQKFNAMAAAWSEVGLLYGREIFNNGEHYLKGAIHPKLTLAAGSAYFYADQLMLNFRNNDTLNVNVSDVRFGYSDNLRDSTIFDKPYAKNILNKTGIAFDFGFVYEWRPHWRKYQTPRDTTKLARNKNKYKAKIGVSVMDIGALRFDRGTFAGNFNGTAVNWDLNTVNAQGIESFGRMLADTFQMTSNRDAYRLRLPTAISFQLDYNVWKGFYINVMNYAALTPNDAPLRLHALSYWAITPRYENTWFDIAMPISVDAYRNVQAGMGARLGWLYVGSSNGFNYMFGDHVRGLNVYAGVKMAIPYPKPRKIKEVLPKDTTTHTPVVKVDTVARVEPVVVDTPRVVEVPEPRVDTPKIEVPVVVKIDTPTTEPVTIWLDTPKVAPIEPTVIQVDTPKIIEEPKPSKRYVYEGHEFKLHPVEVALADNSIYFATGESRLDPAELPKLETLLAIMQKSPDMKILAHGHADNVGGTNVNNKLSLQRAKSVQKYLMSKGIDKKRIVVDSFGKEKQLTDNSSEEKRRLNRRVEIFLLLDVEDPTNSPK